MPTLSRRYEPDLPSEGAVPAVSALTDGTSLDAAVPLWRDYLALTKPEITFLVAVSALAGFFLGSPETLDGWRLLATLAGVSLTAGGSGALNHYLERDLDARMRRTARRPLVTGRIAPERARTFGTVLVAAGLAILCPLTNPLTGVLAALTVVLYLYVYTPLKRVTKYNTLVGTLPGALPALGGYTAATGHPGAAGWALFAVLVCWQMPHFFALAWMYRKDYARAGYAMLPVVEPGGRSTVRQTLFFSLLMLLASLAPPLMGAAGWPYFAGAFLLGLGFLRPVFRFYAAPTSAHARSVLLASIRYIPLLVGCIVLDRLLAWLL
ncbi:MAG: protoheme IX farnesyltransferase [Rhodothermaceae bacterium]|nr:MAG: protoheme IX farnesyltransferase [Rhodothermaceae bacterium]